MTVPVSVHARDETQATVQHHVDLSVVVQRRVRPQSKESSKTVEVPQVQCIDKVTDVPVVVQRQVLVIQTVEKAESNPAGSKADVTWTTEAVTLGHGPSMFETTPEQHMFAVTYADEVAKHINKIVDVPVVSQHQAPNNQTETAEVLQSQFPDGVVADRPVLGAAGDDAAEARDDRGSRDAFSGAPADGARSVGALCDSTTAQSKEKGAVVDKWFVDKGFGFGKVPTGEIVFIHVSVVHGGEVLIIGTDAWVQVVNDEARVSSTERLGRNAWERGEGQGKDSQSGSASETRSGAHS